jgi:hypothetical protein
MGRPGTHAVLLIFSNLREGLNVFEKHFEITFQRPATVAPAGTFRRTTDNLAGLRNICWEVFLSLVDTDLRRHYEMNAIQATELRTDFRLQSVRLTAVREFPRNVYGLRKMLPLGNASCTKPGNSCSGRRASSCGVSSRWRRQ